MRPITFSRIIQTCRIGLELGTIDQNHLVIRFQVSKNRAKEILHEMSEMKLLDPLEQKRFAVNKNTKLLDSHVRNHDSQKLDKYFHMNYIPYQIFRDLLSNNFVNSSITLDEIVDASKKMSIDLNVISVEVLGDWCERLSIIQRNLFTGKIYLLNKKVPSQATFYNTLLECYHSLNVGTGLGIRLVYVSVPQIRELTCERLHVTRKTFDEFLVTLSNNRKYGLELSGAPYNTTQRKSRLTEKKFAYNVLPATYTDQVDYNSKYDEDRGIVFNGRNFYFLAIHKRP